MVVGHIILLVFQVHLVRRYRRADRRCLRKRTEASLFSSDKWRSSCALPDACRAARVERQDDERGACGYGETTG